MSPVVPPSKPTVAILGGGVGGLSAAHELAERGFAVTVYERQATFGGKARSMSVPGSGTGGRKDLPGEHGFRFFPGFYKHITDTMRRIPFGGGGASCADNLVLATRILLARAGKVDPLWVARFPETLDDFRTAFLALFDHLDIPHDEIAFFVTRLLGLATSCEERYLEEFEHMPFWDFIGARTRSENYQRYLGQGMTRSLVAMRAEESSTRTVGRILLQLFYGILVPGGVFDRLLTGPTNDVWIDPWRQHLTGRLGVALHPERDAPVVQSRGRPVAQRDRRAGRTPRRGDGGLLRRRGAGRSHAGPRHAGAGACRAVAVEARRVADRVDERHPVLPRHRSPAGRTATPSISIRTGRSPRSRSGQFWRGYDLSQYGNGRVGGILSVDISNWIAPGNVNGKPALRGRDARRDQGRSVGAAEGGAERARTARTRGRQPGGLVPRSGHPASQSRRPSPTPSHC